MAMKGARIAAADRDPQELAAPKLSVGPTRRWRCDRRALRWGQKVLALARLSDSASAQSFVTTWKVVGLANYCSTLVPRQQGGQIGYTHCSPKRRPGRRAGQRGIGSRVQNPARMGPLECHPGKARPGARSVNRPHLAPAGHRGRLRTSPVARDGITGPLWVVVL